MEPLLKWYTRINIYPVHVNGVSLIYSEHNTELAIDAENKFPRIQF